MNPKLRYYCIVPEQFTMQTQRDFVTLHPRKGILNIDVSSFQRLAYHVLEEVGENGRMILEETGKNIVLQKLAKEHEEDLKILGKNLKKIGYIGEVKSLISEFIQYQVTPELLEEMIEKSGDRKLLSGKLRDVLILYRAFLEYMGEEYTTSDQVLSVFREVLDRSEKLKDSIIVLDGFTAFNPIQLKLIQGLMKTAKKVYVTATIDTSEDAYSLSQKTELFYLSKKMIQSITGAAKEAGVAFEMPVLCDRDGHHRFKNCDDLLFLEQHLFRGGKAVYAGNPEHIRIKEYRRKFSFQALHPLLDRFHADDHNILQRSVVIVCRYSCDSVDHIESLSNLTEDRILAVKMETGILVVYDIELRTRRCLCRVGHIAFSCSCNRTLLMPVLAYEFCRHSIVRATLSPKISLGCIS